MVQAGSGDGTVPVWPCPAISLLCDLGPAVGLFVCSSNLSREQIKQVKGRLSALIVMLFLNYLVDKHVIAN